MDCWSNNNELVQTVQAKKIMCPNRDGCDVCKDPRHKILVVFNILLPSLCCIEVLWLDFRYFFGGEGGVFFVRFIFLGEGLFWWSGFFRLFGFVCWLVGLRFALFSVYVCDWFAFCVLLSCSFMLFLLLKGTMPKASCCLLV